MEGGLGWRGGPGWLTWGGRVRAAPLSDEPAVPSDPPEPPVPPAVPEPPVPPEVPEAPPEPPEPPALPETPEPPELPPEPGAFLSVAGSIRSGAVGWGEASVPWCEAPAGAAVALPLLPPLEGDALSCELELLLPLLLLEGAALSCELELLLPLPLEDELLSCEL